MSDEVQVVKAKSAFDRTLAKLAHMRLWEETPACVAYLAGVRDNPEENTRDRIRATQLLLERTIPTLQRIQQNAVIAHLPMPAEDQKTERALVAPAVEAAAIDSFLADLSRRMRPPATNGAVH